MFQFLEAVENLSEVNRLFIILSRRNVSRIEEGALIDACKRTAGLCSRYPHPRPALSIALSAGLLIRQKGSIAFTERGRLFAARGGTTIDLTQEQARFLIGCLLDDPHIDQMTRALLRKFQLAEGRLIARRSLLVASSDEAVLCRILQQAGALESSEAYFVLNPNFERVFEHLIIRAARLSQEELLERLERQRRRGELAEDKVLEFERTRLKEAKRADLARKVCRVSIHDVAAGYDISSFEFDERPRYIEVKSSVGSQVIFQWSEGERQKALLEGERYFIYFIPLSFLLPTLASSVVILRDPIAMINAKTLFEEPCGYRVTSRQSALVNQDTP